MAKYFVAHRAEISTEPGGATLEELINVLSAYEAYNGLEKEPEKVAETTPEKTENAVVPADDVVEETNTRESELRPVEVGHEVAADEICEDCGKPVDDADIATLGLAMFRKRLCIEDYKKHTKERRENAESTK